MEMAVTAKILCLLIIACFFGAKVCSAQITYSRIIPYDPRYLIRRVPVRRSVEAEQGIRLPITRYFPQVDSQIASAPYLTQEAPAAYRLTNGEVYAVPSKWTEDVIPASAIERNDENDYDTYEYDNEYAPAYARGYPKEFERESEGDLYNDLMVNYLLREVQPSIDESEISEVQRRSEMLPRQFSQNAAVVEEQNTKANVSTGLSTTSPELSSSGPEEAPAPAAVAEPSTSTPTASRKAVNFEAGQRFPKEFALDAFPVENGLWRNINAGIRGQKEFPIFRQSPESSFASLENQLSRSKSSPKNKEALPIIEKLMSAAHRSDPLKEQLDSLKFRNM